MTYSPRELPGFRKTIYFQCYEWELLQKGRQLDVQDTPCTKKLYVAAANEERFVRSGCLWNVSRQDISTLNTASSFTCGRQNICPTARFEPPFSYTIYCLFTCSSPEYSWNTTHLALNNNQAINHCSAPYHDQSVFVAMHIRLPRTFWIRHSWRYILLVVQIHRLLSVLKTKVHLRYTK